MAFPLASGLPEARAVNVQLPWVPEVYPPCPELGISRCLAGSAVSGVLPKTRGSGKPFRVPTTLWKKVIQLCCDLTWDPVLHPGPRETFRAVRGAG